MVARIIMAIVPFPSTRWPWRWVAASLIEALKLAGDEIRDPGAAQRAGKNIEAILGAAIRTAEDDR
jgi:hypothetical protein